MATGSFDLVIRRFIMARILPSTPIYDDDETYYLSEVKYSS